MKFETTCQFYQSFIVGITERYVAGEMVTK